jgi:hypothetical protein
MAQRREAPIFNDRSRRIDCGAQYLIDVDNDGTASIARNRTARMLDDPRPGHVR